VGRHRGTHFEESGLARAFFFVILHAKGVEEKEPLIGSGHAFTAGAGRQAKTEMRDKPILATITGEYFQPVRLHYRVFDHEGLLRAFQKLRCLDYDAKQQRCVWLYEHEAKSLRFKQSYAQIPKHLHPLIIGSFFLRTKDTLLLDLRSCERATLAIPFFDKHVPRSVAKVTEAAVVNKLFSATENEKLTPDSLFDHQGSTFCDPNAAVQRVRELTAHAQDPQEKLEIALEDMQSRAKQPLPEIERFPMHYYEEGIQGFATALQIRQMVALQHWLGNSEYTVFDVIQSMQKSM
jgi:hypothetical protein